MNDDTNQRARDCGRFAEYSDDDLLGQLRMEARGQLDPEYCQFLWAVHARFKALTSAREEALREAAEKLTHKAQVLRERSDELGGRSMVIVGVIVELEASAASILSLITGGGGRG